MLQAVVEIACPSMASANTESGAQCCPGCFGWQQARSLVEISLHRPP